MNPSAIALVYLLPLALSLAVGGLLWRHEQSQTVITTIGFAIAWAIGFYGLEDLWPWQTLPITRAIHWLPISILVSISVSWMLDDRSFKRRWTLFALISMGTLFAWLMLRPFLFKVNSDWSSTKHLMLALALMLGGWVHHLGLVGLSRRLPAPALLCAVGTLILGAMLYSFQGASSAKVAQLLSISGLLAGSLALLAFWRRPAACGASQGWLWSSLIVLPLLYGVYSADEPNLWPLTPLLVATIAGLPDAVRSSVSVARGRTMVVMLGIIVLLTSIGIALTFLSGNDDDDDDDELDAYALLVTEEASGFGLRFDERRLVPELSKLL